MDIRTLIEKELNKKGKIKSSDIIKMTGFSRAYINRFLKELKEEGKIVLIGKANKAIYVKAEKKLIKKAKESIRNIHKELANKGLSEDLVLNDIKNNTGIFSGLFTNVERVIDYAFTEMLNNAIEHSCSRKIAISMKKDKKNIRFDIIDKGVGIFNNIMKRKKLMSELEAIQDLLKGKQTTAPKEHSGEGIFFTSKVADMLIIQSSNKKLTFNNIIEDIYIENNVKYLSGTKVIFIISENSKRKLRNVFNQFTDDLLEFSKTKVLVKLYKIDTEYISRSQARRIIIGLDNFKTVVLDFKKVNTVGQAFADEIFRIWQRKNPAIKIITKNTNENISFMIQRTVQK